MAAPDHDLFLRLYTEHEPSLRGFVRSLLPSREDAREVMQDLAVALWRKFETLADVRRRLEHDEIMAGLQMTPVTPVTPSYTQSALGGAA